MVLTVFILNLHHITDRPMPRWAYILVLSHIAKCLCMSHHVRKAQPEQEDEGIANDINEKDFAQEWRLLAEVVDRFCFWMFLSAIILTTLPLLCPTTLSYQGLTGNETALSVERDNI